MKSLRLIVGSCVVVGLCGYGCKNDPSDDDAGGSSSSGTSAAAGKATSGAAGAKGGHAGSGGRGATSGGTESGAGLGGESGSESVGGTGGSGGSVSGGSGAANDAGAAGDGTDTLSKLRAAIPGPDEVDQQPFLIDSSYVFDNSWVFQIKRTDNGELLMYGQTSAGDPSVAKYSDDLSPIWKKSPLVSDNTTVLAVELIADGTTLVAGGTRVAFAGETQHSSGTDAFVLKLDVDGDPAWAHQWSASGQAAASVVGQAPDGSIFVAGSASGQVQGTPPDNAGGPFAARFESDGTLAFLEQYPGIDADIERGITESKAGPQSLLVDSDGIAHFGHLAPYAHFRTVDESGTLLSEKLLGDSKTYLRSIGDAGASFYGRLGLLYAPDQSSIYNLTFFNSAAQPPTAPPPAGITIVGALSNLDPEGSLRWHRGVGQQTAIIDAVEGVEWHGSFDQFSSIDVIDDSVYITGLYRNTYTNGSTPRQPRTPAFVGRYDLDGAQIWFQEFMIEPETVPLDPVSPMVMGGVFIGSDENPIVVFYGVGGTYAVPLKKSNGKPL